MTIDDRGHAAARELREAVEGNLHLRPGTAFRPPQRRRVLGPLVAVAAAVALVIGLVNVTGNGDSNGTESALNVVEIDLNPLAPNDGRASAWLPVSANPVVDVKDGQQVAVNGSGFSPAEEVGMVMCSVLARDVGIDGCQIESAVIVTTAVDGTFTSDFAVQRLIDVPGEGTIDCAEYAERCLIGVGALSNYDRSGGAPVTFADSGPLPPEAGLAVAPAVDLVDQQEVTVTGDGFVSGEPVWAAQCGGDRGCVSLGGATETFAGPDGSVEMTVEVSRYLPGLARTAGDDHYDCVSYACSLQLQGEVEPGLRQPSSVRLDFDADGPTREIPKLMVTPHEQLEPGDVLTVTGTGFRPGTTVDVTLCTDRREGDYGRCFVVAGEFGEALSLEVDSSGSFAVPVIAPHELRPFVSAEELSGEIEGDLVSPSTSIVGGSPTTTALIPAEVQPIDCTSADGACAVWAWVNAPDGRPEIRPQPVPLAFR